MTLLSSSRIHHLGGNHAKPARNQPLQPEYESSGDFTEWAQQFLAPEEVEQLRVKYERANVYSD